VLRLIVYVERLNILVQAFLLALRSVVWVGVLLVMILYMFAVIAQGLFGQNTRITAAVPENEQHFGSVIRSMLTLIQIMTYDNWAEIVRPIGDIYPAAWIFFLFWLAIAAIGLLNLLTAVFIDALTELSKHSVEKKRKEFMEKRVGVVKWISGLFHRFDTDQSGDLDKSEVDEMFKLFDDKTFKAAMEQAEISVDNIKDAVRYSDKDGNGTIDYQEFLDAVNTMDEATVKRDSWELSSRIRQLDATLELNVTATTDRMNQVSTELKGVVSTVETTMKQQMADTQRSLDILIQLLEKEVGEI